MAWDLDAYIEALHYRTRAKVALLFAELGSAKEREARLLLAQWQHERRPAFPSRCDGKG